MPAKVTATNYFSAWMIIIRICGRRITMIVVQNTTPLDKQAEQEHAAAVTEDIKAVQEYNIMMGVLEDPMTEEEVQ